MHTRSRVRSRLARRLSWLVVLSLTMTALFVPGTSAVFATGPGDNGASQPVGGPASDATVGGSLAAAILVVGFVTPVPASVRERTRR